MAGDGGGGAGDFEYLGEGRGGGSGESVVSGELKRGKGEVKERMGVEIYVVASF